MSGKFYCNLKIMRGKTADAKSTPSYFLGPTYFGIIFVELGGGVGDVPFWCRDGAYVEFGFR